MKVTAQQLRDNGAKLSRTYIYKLSSPVGYVTKNGYVESLFETDKIKRGIASKRLTVSKSMKVADKHRATMNEILGSLESAISKLETQCLAS